MKRNKEAAPVGGREAARVSKDKESIPKMITKIKRSLRSWAIALAVLLFLGQIRDEIVGLIVLIALGLMLGAKLLEAAP